MQGNYFQPEIECASREVMHYIQSKRLRRLVERCYQNVPVYRKRMDEMGVLPGDIKEIEDVRKLPFTTKTDLRDNYPFGLFAVPKAQLARIHASSGTTGKQTVVGYTKADIDAWATGAARSIMMVGGTKEDFVHVSYGYGLFTGGLGLHYGAEKLGATAIPVSSGNTKRQVQILQDYGSDILCCTPSYAMYIGETVRDMGIDPTTLPVRAGIFGAEPWTEQMRKESSACSPSAPLISTVFRKLQDPALPASVSCKTACTSTRTCSIPKSLIPTRAKRCPTAFTASWSLPASARKLSR